MWNLPMSIKLDLVVVWEFARISYFRNNRGCARIILCNLISFKIKARTYSIARKIWVLSFISLKIIGIYHRPLNIGNTPYFLLVCADTLYSSAAQDKAQRLFEYNLTEYIESVTFSFLYSCSIQYKRISVYASVVWLLAYMLQWCLRQDA